MHWTATAPPYTNELERKQGCSLQKAADSRPRPEGQLHSSCTLLQVSAALRWNHTLRLWLAQLEQHSPDPCCCSSCGLAPLPLLPSASGAVLQPARPAASSGNQPGWNGPQPTAKPSLTLAHTRKTSANVSFGSPVGRSHFSIRQRVNPTCLPILSNPVKLITEHNRDQKPSLPIPCWCG